MEWRRDSQVFARATLRQTTGLIRLNLAETEAGPIHQRFREDALGMGKRQAQRRQPIQEQYGKPHLPIAENRHHAPSMKAQSLSVNALSCSHLDDQPFVRSNLSPRNLTVECVKRLQTTMRLVRNPSLRLHPCLHHECRGPLVELLSPPLC